MRTIIANGFESIDGCLHRHQISTDLFETVLTHERNRHLASLSRILPVRTEITVPTDLSKAKEVKQLWD